MNTLKISIILRNLTKYKQKKILINFISRSKFRRMPQPGLSRYFMNGEDVGNEYYENSLTHGSNAYELISSVPPGEVGDDVALCYGVQDFGWGHPAEYIQLNNRDICIASVCKYCGLRYGMERHKDNNSLKL